MGGNKLLRFACRCFLTGFSFQNFSHHNSSDGGFQGFVLQGNSFSRDIRAPDKIVFFPLSPFFPKKTWRREILGNGANDNFPWVFDDFRFMIHTPCSRFFLEKNKKKHIRKKFVPQEFLHDTYSPRIRAPGFPS